LLILSNYDCTSDVLSYYPYFVGSQIIPNFKNENITANYTAVYIFTLYVYDFEVSGRNICKTNTQITVNILDDKKNISISNYYLLASVTALDESVNLDSNINLISSIIYDNSHDKSSYSYYWYETNCFLGN